MKNFPSFVTVKLFIVIVFKTKKWVMITEQVQWLDLVDIFIVFNVILAVNSSLSLINNI